MESAVIENTGRKLGIPLVPQSWVWAVFRHPVPCESLEPPTWEPLGLMLPSSNENTREQKLLERWERKRKGNALRFMTTHPLLVYMDRSGGR